VGDETITDRTELLVQSKSRFLTFLEGHLLQRAVFVIDRNDRIVYAEYVGDQMREPDYEAAMEAVHQAGV